MPVVVDQSVYYTMLEAGICLFAVNLPSLWYLFTMKFPQRFKPGRRKEVSNRLVLDHGRKMAHGPILDYGLNAEAQLDFCTTFVPTPPSQTPTGEPLTTHLHRDEKSNM